MTDAVPEGIKLFMGQGLMGLITLISLYVAWHKDKQVAALYERMTTAAEKMAASNQLTANGIEDVVRRLERRLTSGRNGGLDDR